MIVSFTGPGHGTNIATGRGYTYYRKGVPSYMRKAVWNQANPDDFTEWKSDSGQLGIADRILVVLSQTPIFVLGAVYTLRKLSEVFPTCTIDVLCPAECSELVSWIPRVRVIKTREKAEYYREIFLNEGSIARLGKANEYQKWPIQEHILSESGYYDLGSEDPHVGVIIPGRSEGAGALVLDGSFGPAVRLAGLAELIRDKSRGADIIYVSPETSGLSQFPTLWPAVKSARDIVAIGDIPEGVIAAATGKRVLYFQNANKLLDYSLQYRCYPGAEKVDAAGVAALEDLADRVITHLGETPKPRVVTPPPSPLDPADTVTDKPADQWDSTVVIKAPRRRRAEIETAAAEDADQFVRAAYDYVGEEPAEVGNEQ